MAADEPREPEVVEAVDPLAERQDDLEGRAIHLGVDHEDPAAPLNLLRQEAQEELGLAGAGTPEHECVPLLGLVAQADPIPCGVPARMAAIRMRSN